MFLQCTFVYTKYRSVKSGNGLLTGVHNGKRASVMTYENLIFLVTNPTAGRVDTWYIILHIQFATTSTAEGTGLHD